MTTSARFLFNPYSAVIPNLSPLSHVTMEEREALAVNLVPDSHVVLATVDFCKLAALEPTGLEPDVQKGTIVLPEKLYLSMNVYSIFGACPHQMG